jgi:hypothetical protein
VISFLVGQKYFPVRYNLVKFFGYLGLAVLLYFASVIVKPDNAGLSLAFHSLLVLIYCGVVLSVEKPALIRR